MTDIIVIGGGPAGMTAALYAARAGKSVLLMEKDTLGGQINYSPLVENYPAFAHISGADLASLMKDQLDRQGITPLMEEAQYLMETDDGFVVLTPGNGYAAKAVILAAGVAHRQLGLEREEELVGAGISYCAVCDGAFYEGRDVAVVGGGDTALQDALFLANTCRRVYLIHRRNSFRAEAKLVARARTRGNITILLNQTPTSFRTEDGILTGLELHDRETGTEQTLDVDGVFLAVGQIPQNEIVRGLTDLNDAGYVISGENALTAHPGLFVAGDCRDKKIRQLTTAVSDGACAALAACDYVDGL